MHEIFSHPQVAPISDWVTALEEYYYYTAPTDRIRLLVDRKTAHTLDVCQAVMDIYGDNDRILEIPLYQSINLALVHDVGRFPQVHKGGFLSDEITGIDHAQLSVLLFEHSGLQVEVPTAFLQAIAQHNTYLSNPDSPLGKILRDADKLANLRQIESWFNGQLAKQATPSFCDQDLVTQFCNFQPIDSRGVILISDRMLAVLSWLFDLNIDRTKHLIIFENIPNRLLTFLRLSTPIADTGIPRIETALGQWIIQNSPPHSN